MSETDIPNVLVVELSFFQIYHAVFILKFKKCKKTIFSKFFIATRIFKNKNSRPTFWEPLIYRQVTHIDDTKRPWKPFQGEEEKEKLVKLTVPVEFCQINTIGKLAHENGHTSIVTVL